jgi:4-aminobutyrate aminotransferase-like enzyme
MDRLAAVESRNVTWRDPAGEDAWPVVWTEAKGANVRDADGNLYLDLTAAFGVALAGHRPAAVEAAIVEQAGRLVHGMGDIHPPEAKIRLLEALASVLPWPAARATLATSGSEAVEIALKTAQLASADVDHPQGRPGIIAFVGGYHGLTLGALAPTHRDDFRAPFASRTWGGVAWAPYPGTPEDPTGERAMALVAEWLAVGVPAGDGSGGGARVPVGAVIVEPVQARGGVRVFGGQPEAGHCPGVGRALSDLVADSAALLVADEIFSGLGRCGATLASERVGLCPDVVALGKVLGGGLPVSACVGSPEVMDAWPASPGEALHTSTFLGHPLACAAGAAMLESEVATGLPARAEAAGERLAAAVGPVLEGRSGAGPLRGLGLLLGFDCLDPEGRPEAGGAVEVAERLMRRGVMILPAGPTGAVVELTPPAVLTDAQIDYAAASLAAVLDELGR